MLSDVWLRRQNSGWPIRSGYCVLGSLRDGGTCHDLRAYEGYSYPDPIDTLMTYEQP